MIATAGTEKFSAVAPNYFRHANGVMVMYDLTDYESFENVTTWKFHVQSYSRTENIPHILVGNKADIDEPHIDGQQVAEDLGMDGFFKTSSLTGEGVVTALKSIIVMIAEDYHKLSNASIPNTTSVQTVPIMKPVRKKKFCC